MQNNQKPKNEKEFALQQFNVARSNLLLMIILTIVNVVLLAVGTDTMLLFSATVPYYIAAFGIFAEATQLFTAVCFSISAVILVLYLFCWIFSKKHYGWMIAALVFFILDSIAMIGLYIIAEDFSGILDLIIHIWVLYYLIIGVKNGYKLKNTTFEEVEVEQDEPQILQSNDANDNNVEN